jgi:hypothetical protein
MKQVTTFVGIDAHKKDLFVAMLLKDKDVDIEELGRTLGVLAPWERLDEPAG